MLCPFCGYESSKVLESRSTAEKSSIRRRRECESCQRRFTTYEKIELMPILVIKKNGSREEYQREKLFSSIIKACNKCDIPLRTIDELIDSIELDFSLSGKREINSLNLGEKVLTALKALSEIAYIRYLSVFREFKTIDDFMQELKSLTRQMSLLG